MATKSSYCLDYRSTALEAVPASHNPSDHMQTTKTSFLPALCDLAGTSSPALRSLVPGQCLPQGAQPAPSMALPSYLSSEQIPALPHAA